MADGIKPKCDFCDKEACFDGLTKLGPWAYMCEEHFKLCGTPIAGLYKRLTPTLTKQCRLCNRRLPVTEFYQYRDKAGVLRYRSECKSCNLRIKKDKYQRNKEED